MRRTVRVLVLLTILTGCGGVSVEGPVGFINQTQHDDADLWMIWQAAQESVAKQIDLNPVQQSQTGAPAENLPGNAIALDTEPREILVAPVQDVSSTALSVATGVERPDPTGLIACPPPCQVRYTPAYSTYAQPATKYAASWEGQEQNFSSILQYEFENHILNALGYDTKWR